MVHSTYHIFCLRKDDGNVSLTVFCFVLFFSVGVHVLVEDVNEFAPKWSIRSDEKEISEEAKHQQPVHTLTTNVAIEEGQLLEEVRRRFLRPICHACGLGCSAALPS